MSTGSTRKRMMSFVPRVVGLLLLGMISQTLAFAQQAPTTQQSTQGPAGSAYQPGTADVADARLSLAVSSADYPVTPGDVYLLTYYQTAETHVSTEVLVNGDWEINLGVFGRINGRGLTFTQLKQRVEELIANSYSRSLPSLRIETPGVFRVAVTGEVERLQYVMAWGLTKLSTIVDGAKDRYSSLRRVEVRSADGGSKQYDLSKAMRFGHESEDPYVKPGDTIVLVPQGQTVTLSGEVRHPGTYELLHGEGLRDLIEEFGGGTTADADRSRIRIERSLALQPHAEYVSIPQAYASDVVLSDGDVVVVTSRADRRSVVWFEGAVSPPPSEGGTPEGQQPRGQVPNTRGRAPTGAEQPMFDRFALPIRRGEMLSDALREVRGSLLPTANLAAATLQHADQTTTRKVDLTQVMAQPGSAGDIPLQPNDRVFLPSLPSTVSVFGAVMAPGFFSYEPGEPPSYYIGLAGGVDPERNSRGQYSVTDANGKPRSGSEAVNPGDRVYVPLNAFGYRVARTAPTVIAILSAVLNTVTFVYLLARQ